MGGRRILSDEQLAEMAELRERGWGLGRIAEHFTKAGTPISKSSINWQCMRVGADAPPHLRGHQRAPREIYWRNGTPCRPWTEADDRQLLELEMTGISVMEITRRLGRSNSSVRGRLLTLSRHDARREEATC
ncbi:hypothetical protein FIM10_04180 [Sphingomonadales bacterium 56]|uniref:hypothetical protein n=1 Tax=unclassified Sphingobium TaxID=2611147 RepID=UPI0019195778|nr:MULTISPECIES: hypothetical protein [unclassified Sphingobium]MBY2927874.1 hypothetical protein [Sphingomonadales bacterium 56]MBY2957974.1 hypothetical protein [Sphingomonadales bacterium 58]CAD7336112.1 hypothetical protein SPHS6_00847 [Sphingobium sp. S6]CAD7336177.1 hypothetical protein SPHS8_00888 [Sphingobium sp. S8]